MSDTTLESKPWGKNRKPTIDASELFDRTPPHHIDAERSLLGSILLDPMVLTEIVEIVSSPEQFYKEAHGTIFARSRRLNHRLFIDQHDEARVRSVQLRVDEGIVAAFLTMSIELVGCGEIGSEHTGSSNGGDQNIERRAFSWSHFCLQASYRSREKLANAWRRAAERSNQTSMMQMAFPRHDDARAIQEIG